MRWPPYEHVFFDCDSTLTTVEGIDILAETVGKGWRVEVLTQAAMDGALDLEEIYAKRLRAIKPTRQQVREIRRVYKRNKVLDADLVIRLLQEWGHQVYIISGGLAEPVREFGLHLGVPESHIRAVTLEYDQLVGNWWESEPNQDRYRTFHEGALTASNGKADIIRDLVQGTQGRSLLIGDGHSDLLAANAVDLFVGFGGVIKRETVLQGAPAFVHSTSMLPLLALAAGPAALRQLLFIEQPSVAANTIELMRTGAITFTDERLKTKFDKAFRAAYSSFHPRTH